MYEIFEQLLQQNGITSYKVSKDTGIGQSTLSAWKMGKSNLKPDKLRILADYFGVSIDRMLGIEENEKEVPTVDEKELVLDYKDLSLEDKAKIRYMIKEYKTFDDRTKNHAYETIKYMSESQPKHIEELRAAHNDDANSKEEQRLMKEDLDEL